MQYVRKNLRPLKKFKKITTKNVSISAELESDAIPWELLFICSLYIYGTKQARIYFDGSVKDFREWLEDNYFVPNKFSTIIRKHLPTAYNFDFLTGINFAFGWGIDSIKQFEHKSTTPYTLDLRVQCPSELHMEIGNKFAKLNPIVEKLCTSIDNTFSEINETSEGLVSIFYKKLR